jgi:hypothetical protein
MKATLVLTLSLIASVADAGFARAAAAPGEPSKGERLLALHTDDAAAFTIYRDAGRKEAVVLRREPIYRWTNPTRVGGQVGDVFIWTHRGRPEVVASIFSHPSEKRDQRVICHELHSLSPAVLVVEHPGPNTWVPQAAGVELAPVDGAPVPAATAAERSVQMRSLARQFGGRALSDRGQNWDLRLLPQPLYRYESSDPAVIDGALFALISSAGTDPEILLLLEARKTEGGAAWVFGAARFSDMNLWLSHKDKVVWSSIRGPENTFNHDAKHRFRFYIDRSIPELDDAGASSSKTK